MRHAMGRAGRMEKAHTIQAQAAKQHERLLAKFRRMQRP
jgi:hypothetical protein